MCDGCAAMFSPPFRLLGDCTELGEMESIEIGESSRRRRRVERIIVNVSIVPIAGLEDAKF